MPNVGTIGVWAPILLCVLRVAQGLGVGAEWGGAVTMAIEHAPADRRALYGAAPTIGLPAGLGLANLVLIVLMATTGPAFHEWGWRIAFVASAVLVFVGVWARHRLGESPLFEESGAVDIGYSSSSLLWIGIGCCALQIDARVRAAACPHQNPSRHGSRRLRGSPALRA